ncbi:type I-B CRISPR-associated endonuclease Cas1b [Sulfoacidibacillus thermotolerans]|uniref:CRISPR-associated endonuclease Cas1 n=1 Tax=Sulfoacidibacillus thermotolerans TaxID=1765684 RepID=A0A2U3D714_SULT2|nr:type I-B CRISPR-associated endonuclease Cas1b [Sulfoacidibacillus thermotolerans]PWI57043.1 subtype I-B CRISPR-associated endonuclease Cas1 [Sulfoacidibacillus thermotolerans]
MEKSLYVFSNGELKRKDNTLFFETAEGKKFIPITTVRDILLFGEVTFNSRVLNFLSEQEVLIHYFNHYGYYSGTIYPREHIVSGSLILRQVEHYLSDPLRVDIARRFVGGAAQNLRRVLKYYMSRGRNLESNLERIESLIVTLDTFNDIPQLMAVEGNIRETYYDAFDEIIQDKAFAMNGRTKRPPRNPLNALISFGNSLLYTTVLSEIYKTHLDPRIGYLHATNFRRFTLNLDIAEIFKPILVDRMIFTIISKNMLKSTDFVRESGGVLLNDAGRSVFLKQWDDRLQQTIQLRDLGRSVSYRRLIRMELYKLEKHLIGEKPYEPFAARW